MKALNKCIITIALITVVPGAIALGQTVDDSASVLQQCIDISELEEFFPSGAEGQPEKVYIIQYPVAFSEETAVWKAGVKIPFANMNEIPDNEIRAYFMFREFKIDQSTALVNMSFFYKTMENPDQMETLMIVMDLKKIATEWQVTNKTIKQL